MRVLQQQPFAMIGASEGYAIMLLHQDENINETQMVSRGRSKKYPPNASARAPKVQTTPCLFVEHIPGPSAASISAIPSVPLPSTSTDKATMQQIWLYRVATAFYDQQDSSPRRLLTVKRNPQSSACGSPLTRELADPTSPSFSATKRYVMVSPRKLMVSLQGASFCPVREIILSLPSRTRLAVP